MKSDAPDALAPPPAAGRAALPRIALGLLIVGIALLPHLPVPEYWITLANYMGIYALAALGLVLLTGVAGLTSFGQAAFVGMGAYATALLSTQAGFGP
ncbi:MAG: metal-dependent hydrolase, partial [Betaproteobacteria bacterium]|nr:metal-dependent hydrolase [Betaproteobacteria bacterium]